MYNIIQNMYRDLYALSLEPIYLLDTAEEVALLEPYLIEACKQNLNYIEFNNMVSPNVLTLVFENIRFNFFLKGINMVAYSIEKDGILSLNRDFEAEILESLGGKFDETFEEELIKSDFKFDFLICQNSENPLDSILVKENGITTPVGSYRASKEFKDCAYIIRSHFVNYLKKYSETFRNTNSSFIEKILNKFKSN